ncbi:hypothetical protein [Clostridium sp.]|uniref:hypothetical protein n=1 Tax=Clostridium sp. TaxID=1506 RepID=UPI00284C3822|nr:hypothetical protein [Clostridium sp.]MDR3597131.1 hypothetical protein [Clostridium sp.]
MSELLIPININEFKDIINIRFNTILDGFDNFENFTLMTSDIKNGENKITEFIEKVFETNNYECYIDFYINKISNEDKQKLLTLVSDEDKKILKLHLNAPPHDGVFYKLTNKSLIPFLVRLNTREIFFVTFYFVYKPITIWGNYGLKFPCFFSNQSDLEFYHEMCKSFGLLE